jgi:hypothetical protein
MLAAVVPICSLASVPDASDCTRSSATAVMRMSAEFGGPVACFTHVQAYPAASSVSQELARAVAPVAAAYRR